jgi:hypothetical protein
MLNLNTTILEQIASKAIADAAAHPRWVTAIGRALVELDTNPWIARGELHGLVIGSPSGNVYAANGTCQCQAYLHGQACWHRAAARLVRLHDEAIERGTNAAPAPSLSTTVDTPRAPLGERLAAARKATAQLNDLFA